MSEPHCVGAVDADFDFCEQVGELLLAIRKIDLRASRYFSFAQNVFRLDELGKGQARVGSSATGDIIDSNFLTRRQSNSRNSARAAANTAYTDTTARRCDVCATSGG